MERNRQPITVTITVAITLALTQGTKPTLARLFNFQDIHLTFNLFSNVNSDKPEPKPNGPDDSTPRQPDDRHGTLKQTQDWTRNSNSRRHSSRLRRIPTSNTHCSCKPIPTYTDQTSNTTEHHTCDTDNQRQQINSNPKTNSNSK